MAVVNIKEIYKEYYLAKKHFKKAIELAKKSVVVGEINFPTKEKKIVRERLKKLAKIAPEGKTDDSILPDLDKDGYMNKRKKHETADNA